MNQKTFQQYVNMYASLIYFYFNTIFSSAIALVTRRSSYYRAANKTIDGLEVNLYNYEHFLLLSYQ